MFAPLAVSFSCLNLLSLLIISPGLLLLLSGWFPWLIANLRWRLSLACWYFLLYISPGCKLNLVVCFSYLADFTDNLSLHLYLKIDILDQIRTSADRQRTG